MKQHQQWATITQTIHSELVSIYSNITSLTIITTPLNWCIVSLSAQATTPSTPVTKLLLHTHKISFHLQGFITLINIFIYLCVNKLILLTLELSGCGSTFDILEHYEHYRHYVSKVTIKICHNLGILKSLSTNLDPNEATGTIGGNFAFRIVFCNVDIVDMILCSLCRHQNIKLPQPFAQHHSFLFLTVQLYPNSCQSVSNDWFRISVTSGTEVYCQVMFQVQSGASVQQSVANTALMR